MMSKEEYKNFVVSMANNESSRLFLNSDEEHALIVLVNLFKSANTTIRIFAGCLCEHVGNKPEYIEAISDFIERGGSVKILLNNYNESEVSNSSLFKRLAYYASSGKSVEVKRTNSHPYLTNDAEKKDVHFTVMDGKGYRLETDIVNRTAECNFNDPIFAGKAIEFFDSVFDNTDTTSIDLNSLFGNVSNK